MIAGVLALGLALPAAAQAPMGPMTKADFMARGKAQLEAFDTDHDGSVSREELVAAITKQMGGPPPAAMVDGIMGSMDADHDGKLAPRELQRAGARPRGAGAPAQSEEPPPGGLPPGR